jgi:hypothetical protein
MPARLLSPKRELLFNGRPSYASVIGADHPTHVWYLDEASGTTAADAAKPPLHGTYAGTPSLFQTANPLLGGRAVLFDGVDDAVTFASAAFTTDTGWSIDFWVKSATASQYGIILMIGDDDHGYGVGQGNGVGGAGTKFVLHAGAFENAATGTVSTIAWQYIAVTCAAGSTFIKLYLNAKLALTAAGETDPPDNIMSFGAQYDATGTTLEKFFTGTIDNIATYPAELSPSRVMAHYLAGVI